MSRAKSENLCARGGSWYGRPLYAGTTCVPVRGGIGPGGTSDVISVRLVRRVS